MKHINTTLATIVPVLAETVGELKADGQDVPTVLEKFSTAATDALQEYGRSNPTPKAGQDIPFPVRCRKEDVTSFHEALDGVFMDQEKEEYTRMLNRHGVKELRRRQGILYSFCFDLKRYYGI